MEGTKQLKEISSYIWRPTNYIHEDGSQKSGWILVPAFFYWRNEAKKRKNDVILEGFHHQKCGKQISENLQISIFCIQYVLAMNID